MIVGAASWKSPHGSLCHGRFVDTDDADSEHKHVFTQEEGADKDTRAYGLLDAACERETSCDVERLCVAVAVALTRDRLFTDHTTMDVVVVQPAYWRRAFGAPMVR